MVQSVKKILRSLSPGQIQLRLFEKANRYTPGSYTIRGRRFYFPDGLSFAYMYSEIFETEIYQFKTTNPTPYIIDCGANVGLSVAYFKIKYPGCKVLAFEPDGQIFKYLSRNMESFGFNDVELINTGLWNEDNVLSFRHEGSDSGRIEESALQRGVSGDNTVKVETLGKYLNREVDLLKVDIEGAEVEVIKECGAKLRHCKNIFLEYHSFESQPQHLHELLSIFNNNDFRYYINTPVNLRKRPFAQQSSHLGMDGFVNIFASRI